MLYAVAFSSEELGFQGFAYNEKRWEIIYTRVNQEWIMDNR